MIVKQDEFYIGQQVHIVDKHNGLYPNTPFYDTAQSLERRRLLGKTGTIIDLDYTNSVFVPDVGIEIDGIKRCVDVTYLEAL